MALKTKYYLDGNDRLWKKNDYAEYFFSRKKLEWVKSEIVYIWPHWEWDFIIDPKEAKKVLSIYKKGGKLENEETPIRYFANDNDTVFAVDIYGNEFYVLADKTLMPAAKGTVDCMWGGLSSKEVDDLCRKECEKDEWILVGCGNRLVRYIDDYIGTIWLDENCEENLKSEVGFRAGIQLDDNIDYPYFVSYPEAPTVEELKEKTEKEMKERAAFRNRPYE